MTIGWQPVRPNETGYNASSHAVHGSGVSDRTASCGRAGAEEELHRGRCPGREAAEDTQKAAGPA